MTARTKGISFLPYVYVVGRELSGPTGGGEALPGRGAARASAKRAPLIRETSSTGMTRRSRRGKTAPTVRERKPRAGKGQRTSRTLQRLRPAARRSARIHRARRTGRRDRAHQGRGLE